MSTERAIRDSITNLNDSQRRTLSAIRSAENTQVATAALREWRDTKRHAELLEAHQRVAASLDALHDGIRSELNLIADRLRDQSEQLGRIATAVESPRAIQAAELRRMAASHFNAGDIQRALAMLLNAIELDGTDRTTRVALAFALHGMGEHDRASVELEQAVKYPPAAAAEQRAMLPGGHKDEAALLLHIAAQFAAEGGTFLRAAKLLMHAMDIEGDGYCPSVRSAETPGDFLDARFRSALDASASRYYELVVYLALANENEQAIGAFLRLLHVLPSMAAAALDDPRLRHLDPVIRPIAEPLLRERKIDAMVFHNLFIRDDLPELLTTVSRERYREAKPGPAETLTEDLYRYLRTTPDTDFTDFGIDLSGLKKNLEAELKGWKTEKRRDRLFLVGCPLVILAGIVMLMSMCF